MRGCPPGRRAAARTTTQKFQYDVDAQTGQAIRHTCDPNQLGTYYDPPDTPSRPHYLTPVNFNREVLGRYKGAVPLHRIRDAAQLP